MAQRKQLTWTELRVGLFVLAGIVLVVVGIFYVTGTGALGPKYRLVTYLPEVDGLAIGAPVTDQWRRGRQRRLHRASLPSRPGQPPAAESQRRSRHEDQSQFPGLYSHGFLCHPGHRRLPGKSRGHPSARLYGQVLRDGQEVPGKEEKAMKEVVERGADLMQNLSALVLAGRNDGRRRFSKAKAPSGKLLTDETAYNRINSRPLARRSDHRFRAARSGNPRQVGGFRRTLHKVRLRRRTSR